MTAKKPSRLSLYLTESRDIGRSLVLVVPLLVAYEVGMPLLAPNLRNSAEWSVSQLLAPLPDATLLYLRRATLSALVIASLLWTLSSRRNRAQVARPYLILAESAGLALLLGPALGALVHRLGLPLSASPTLVEPSGAWVPFALSVGAGLWEELVFRLGLMGGLVLLGTQVLRWRRGVALGGAVLVSAAIFALYHHMGETGEPLEPARFVFRALAGTILGLLFAWRGLAVVVYMHVFYDVLCDLRVLATT
ncbi:MAG: hypothetical protein DHS20C15_01840 [Planctomycetota bacterium]|nr:MAG: hypothetical protein DHS20C15_01840 [Planctomycetota bacterium]